MLVAGGAAVLLAAVLAPRFWRLAVGLVVVLCVAIFLVPLPHRVSSAEWVPSLGAGFDFRVDGLSLLFVRLISGIGALIFAFLSRYSENDPKRARLLVWLAAFMVSMLGLVLADSAITLFIFWELTTITSFFLIGHKAHDASARRSAVQALVVTGIAGLALLAGLIWLSIEAGTSRFSQMGPMQGQSSYVAVFALIAIGCFAKSAQAPLHFWLPNAMAAPTPVSAYLHSATMVKAGIYLLARLAPVLGGTDEWLMTLGAVGSVTMLVGTVLAWRAADLKRMLAGTTVASLGTLVMLLAFSSTAAAGAFTLFLISHAIYKAGLFMAAGVIEHETGSRDVRSISGLAQLNRPLAVGLVLLACASAAAPGVITFIAKEEAWLVAAQMPGLALPGLLLASIGNAIVAWRFGWLMLRGEAQSVRVPLVLLAGPLFLGVASFALVPLLGWRWEVGLGQAAAAVAGVQVPMPPLWHGFRWPLFASLGAIVIGAWLVRSRTPWEEHEPVADQAYDMLRNWVLRLGDWSRAPGDRLGLRTTVSTFWVVLVALVGWRLVQSPFPWSELSFQRPMVYEVLLVSLAAASGVAVLFTHSRLAAIALMGVVGLVVCALYLLFGAPDLALTQVVVETLTVLLYVLVFYHLPRFTKLTRTSSRLRDAVVALAVGGLMTGLTLAVLTHHTRAPISQEFGRLSLVEAYGRNVVNVILVDFRGFDTLGEILVLALAALGVFSLLKVRPVVAGGAS